MADTFKVGDTGTFTGGQKVTILEVYENALFVGASDGAKFTIQFVEFKKDPE